MLTHRRCGVLPILISCVLLVLASAPTTSNAQAITLVRSGVRYAGTGSAGYNGDSGAASAISLNTPSYVVFDSAGNQYLSDTLNNCVRRIDTTGNVTTIAGLAVAGQPDTCNAALNPTPTASQGLYQPTGLAIDSNGLLYISDSLHNCVRSLASGVTGVANLTTVAGTCGSAPTASVTPAPNGLAINSAGNLFIAIQDSSSATPVYQVVEHVRGANPVNACYIAGAASANVNTGCPAVINNVLLVKPSGLAFDISGNLFIADTGNNCIREAVGLTTLVSAIGQCLNDGSGSSATAVHNPYGLAFSNNQTLFISESNPDNVVSYLPGASSLSLVAGLPSGVAGPYNPSQDGKSALNSPLNGPRGLAVDANSNLFVLDSGNNIDRQLNFNLHFATTPVGSPSALQLITFAINQPVNLSVNTGTDYSITNSSTCSGSLSPAASGAPPNTCQIFVRFNPTRPGQRNSSLNLTDSLTSTSFLNGLQGIGTGPLALFYPGTTTSAASGLASPVGITVDSAGNAYVLETSGANPDISFIPAGGGASRIIFNLPAGLISPNAITSDAAGNWFVTDATRGIVARLGANGSYNLSYVTGLDTPTAVLADNAGNLFIAQAGTTHNVIEVYASGARRVIAGSGSAFFVTNGVPANTVSFVSPSGLASDLNGTLYVADSGAHQVYAIDTAGNIHIVAGNGTTTTTVAGQATGTALLAPASLAVDAAGDVYIADQATGIIYIVYSSSTNSSNIAALISPSTPPAANTIISIALDGSSNLFVSNSATNSVLELTYPNPTLNFGGVAIGKSSGRVQGLTNVGTGVLNINQPVSTSNSHFTVDPSASTCGMSVVSGTFCNLGYLFAPTTVALYNATSIINSNSFNTPQPIALNGFGTQPVAVTITLSPQTEVYGQSFPETVTFNSVITAPTGTITFTTGSQTLCTLSGNLSAVTTCTAPNSGLSVGTYTVTFNYSGDANYLPAAGTVALTVTPAPLVETVNNVSRAYATPNPTFTGTLTGAAPGDTILVSFATTATTASPVGTYPITATLTAAGSTNLSNYTVSVVNGTLTVTAATSSLVINVNDATRPFGQPNPAFSGTVTGLLPGDNITVTYSTTATITSPVGTYPITAVVSGPSAGNYTPTINPGTLTITPGSTNTTSTTITTSLSPAPTGVSVTFTATVTALSGTAAGTVNFLDGAVLLGSATLNSTSVATFSTSALSVGSHTISAAFQANTNFGGSAASLTQVITLATGSFTIAATPPTPFIKGAGSTLYQVTVGAVGAFAGSVALTCSGLPADSTCTFANPTVSLTAGGTATTTMTVTTTAADASLRQATPLAPSNFAPITVAAVFPLELSGLGVLFAGIGRRKTLNPRKLRLLLLIVCTLGILGLAGCGCPSTAFQTYTIQITGTSLTFPAPVQTTSVVLSVGLQ